MILLDTSVLVDALTGPRRSAEALRATIEQGERLLLPSVVLYEWLRGPRRREELDAQEALFPREEAVAFGAEEASRAADLFQRLGRPRRRAMDLAIAAGALVRDAALWTLNLEDFEDIPGLRLHHPA